MTDQYSCSRRRLLGLTTRAALALPLVFVAASARADDFFSPPKIGEFTGLAWGKLAFGQTTQEGIKRDWKNGRGDFRNSVELKTRESLPYKISALFPTVQKTATLDGILIRWRDDNQGGLPIGELKAALGDGADGMVTRYPTVRHDEWEVALWQQKGIAALVLDGRAAWVLLGRPAKISDLASRLASEAVSLSPVPDPGEGKNKEVVYGSVQASFDLKNIDLDRKDRERDDIERDLRRAGDGDNREPLRYESGATGKYEMTIYAHSRDDKETDGRVDAHITGTTPYGPIDVSTSETFRVGKGERYLDNTTFARSVGTAAQSVERKAGDALRQQKPPTAESVRRAAWTQLVEDYRNLSTNPTASGGLL